MTSQQIADEALALWRSHKGDDQERVDSLLREFFAQVRADEYEHQLRCVSEIMSCSTPMNEPYSLLDSSPSDSF